MNKDDIVLIPDDEVDAVLDALGGFGAAISGATASPAAPPAPDVRREEVGGCVVLRPDFRRRR